MECKMIRTWVLLLVLLTRDCWSQDEEGPYKGKFIGRLNSYHHQVSGEVYAVDEWTILLVNFNYDGTGEDTFFWSGEAPRPGPQGFIVPNEFGRTNILERYYNAEIRLTLPEGKRISRVKWLAVYDIGSQNAFGDVYVPDEFEPPAPRSVGPLAGSPAVASKQVQFLDANTLLIPELRYDGSGEEVYFWTGVGPQPSSRGIKIPDEYGYLEPIRAYKGEDVRLELPGGRTVFDVNWVALWDAARQLSLGAVLVPDALNVPPALLATHDYESKLPNCKQLHRDYQVSWEVFGNQITFELAAQMEEDEYMSFGISGSDSNSSMLGADVAVASYSSQQQRGVATDYNITALAPCVQVLGQWRGVCRDDVLGGLDSNQVFSARRDGRLTVVSYRRQLQPAEPMDREWVVSAPTHVVWALGRLDHAREPAFHRLYPRQDLRLHLGRALPDTDCVKFTVLRHAQAGGAVGGGGAVRPVAARVPVPAGPGGRAPRAGGPRRRRRRAAARLVRQRAAGSRPADPPRPQLQLQGVRRQQPALGDGVPPAGGDGGARGRAGAAVGAGAARSARAGRRALHAPRPPRAHRSGPAVPGAARGGRGPAPRRRLRDVPRVQPLARVGLPRRAARRAARRAQLHVARHRLLPLLHARRHGRAHLRGGPAPAQHRPSAERRGPLAPLARLARTARRRRRRSAREPRRTLVELLLFHYTIAACCQLTDS